MEEGHRSPSGHLHNFPTLAPMYFLQVAVERQEWLKLLYVGKNTASDADLDKFHIGGGYVGRVDRVSLECKIQRRIQFVKYDWQSDTPR